MPRSLAHLGCLLLFGFASACGTSTDDRPATLANITESILKPSCASAECHSSFAQEKGYDFDSVDNARRSFQGDPVLVDIDDIGTDIPPTLILNLTLEQGPGARRMPFDAPLPNGDIDLIQRWLETGLVGICTGDNACLGNKLMPCVNGAYDLANKSTATLCASGCANGACL